MADEKDIKTIHGFEINSGGHGHAIHFMEKHLNKEQLHEMVHTAKTDSDHNSHFTARINGRDIEYKLEHHDGKLKIHEAHH